MVNGKRSNKSDKKTKFTFPEEPIVPPVTRNHNSANLIRIVVREEVSIKSHSPIRTPNLTCDLDLDHLDSDDDGYEYFPVNGNPIQTQKGPQFKHLHPDDRSKTKARRDGDRETVYEFRIVENCGSGNCLFFTIDEFLHVNGSCPHNSEFVSNENKLRKAIVSFIVKADRAPRRTKGQKILDSESDPNFGNNNREHKSKAQQKSYSNWLRFRHEIKTNLEDHVAFFKHYSPGCDDEEQEETARQVYKHYMNQSGTYGTSAELHAAMELYSFGATIVAQDARVRDKYVIYHLDLNNSDTKLSRRPRIYIHFQGSPGQGHFELLEPITVMTPWNPSPLRSGHYNVHERSDRERYFRLIQVKGHQRSNDPNDWATFCRALQTWKRENECNNMDDDNDLTLTLQLVHQRKRKHSKESPPLDCGKKGKTSIGKDGENGQSGNQEDFSPDSDRNLNSCGVRTRNEHENEKQEGKEQNLSPFKSKSDDSHNPPGILENSIEQSQSPPESEAKPDPLLDFVDFEDAPGLREKEIEHENKSTGQLVSLANERSKVKVGKICLDPDLDLDLTFDQNLYHSAENVVLSSAEQLSFHSQYSLHLAELQADLVQRGRGIPTGWKGIKVSRVMELNNFYTNFLLLDPGARKPLSRTNYRTHFVIYNKGSIFISVFESEDQIQSKSAVISKQFSMGQGRLYTLENTLEHPVLLRIWWMLPEVEENKTKSDGYN